MLREAMTKHDIPGHMDKRRRKRVERGELQRLRNEELSKAER